MEIRKLVPVRVGDCGANHRPSRSGDVDRFERHGPAAAADLLDRGAGVVVVEHEPARPAGVPAALARTLDVGDERDGRAGDRVDGPLGLLGITRPRGDRGPPGRTCGRPACPSREPSLH